MLTHKLKFDLLTKKNYKNIYQLPKLQKIILNMGLKEALMDKYTLLPGIFTLQLISGKKPVITKSKHSISAFKLRKGVPLGLKVLLRKNDAFLFLKKLNLIILSADDDFIEFNNKNFDKKGNFSFGIKELYYFPEINHQLDQNNLRKIYGLNINVILTSKNKTDSKLYLSLLGLPFLFKNKKHR